MPFDEAEIAEQCIEFTFMLSRNVFKICTYAVSDMIQKNFY